MSQVGKLLVVAAVLLAVALGINAYFFTSEDGGKEVVVEDTGKAEMLRALREGSQRPGGPPMPGAPSAPSAGR